MESNMKILHLSLKKPQFEIMVSGEKNIEYRKANKWILSRLVGKSYDYVKFTNGYGNSRPYFICEFRSWAHATSGIHRYSNGLTANVTEGHVQINLGNIITKQNVIIEK